MKRFVEGEDRRQGVLLPEFLDDYVSEENAVRVIDVFVEELDLGALGFEGVVPEATGRPAYHPGLLLKIYVSGYINQIASSRRLEREAQRNVELLSRNTPAAPCVLSRAAAMTCRALCVRALRGFTFRSSTARAVTTGANDLASASRLALRGSASPTTDWWPSFWLSALGGLPFVILTTTHLFLSSSGAPAWGREVEAECRRPTRASA
jgi:hypothetical protein